MDEKLFYKSIKNLLDSVVSERTNFLELQRFVDNLIISDELPDSLPDELLTLVYELQADLEMIAVNHSENMGSKGYLSNSEVSERLKKYADSFKDI